MSEFFQNLIFLTDKNILIKHIIVTYQIKVHKNIFQINTLDIL